jgi:glycosyltransferase involved in cell wall biosynthesis
MRICFVTTNFPRYPGDGEGTFIWEAARAVACHGHTVRVIAQHWKGLPTRQWMEGIEVIRPRYWWPESAEMLRREGGGLPVIWRESWLARLQMVAFLGIHSLAVARYARDCDVIHAQWTLSAGAAWISRLIHRRPIVVTLHGSDVFQAAQGWLGGCLTRQVLNGCDRIVSVSQALAQAVGRLRIAPASIVVIPDGVDVAQFRPALQPRQPEIVYVGSLIKRKGLPYLLEAMVQVVRELPALRLTIVGDGPERAALESTAVKLGLSECVTFAGLQSADGVRQAMQRAMAFVLPSVEEGLGVVLLEALACGTPIVASRVGGIPEVVTAGVGRLVPPADPPALAQVLIQMLHDEASWPEMSRNARRRAEDQYDWSKVAARMIGLYRTLLPAGEA